MRLCPRKSVGDEEEQTAREYKKKKKGKEEEEEETKNGEQIGEDRKCWPLQCLQTKRICEACTSSLFPLKEEPVSTFPPRAEKLALALHVTSAVF